MQFDLDEGGWNQTPSFPTSFTWRAEPTASFSDWTIAVVCEDEREEAGSRKRRRVEGQDSVAGEATFEANDGAAELNSSVDTYHVHKAVLSRGERASGYFFTLFTASSSIVREAAEARSVLHMPAACSACFPLLLDYIYEARLSLEAANLLPLMELARRLQIPGLGKQVASAMDELLNEAWDADELEPQQMQDMSMLLTGSIEFHMEKVQAAALKVVGAHFTHFQSDEMLGTLPVELLLKLLSDDELAVWSEDEVLECILTRVRATDNEAINEDALRKLWGCLRFASLSTARQIMVLQEPTAPRDLFLRDAVACLVKQQLACGRGEWGSLLQQCDKMDSETCLRPRGFARGDTRAFTLRCGGSYRAAVQPLATVLLDADCRTGVVALSREIPENQGASWIELEFKSDCLITNILVRAYRGTVGGGGVRVHAHSMSTPWIPRQGRGAHVEYRIANESTFERVGEIPRDFGERSELQEVSLRGPFVARAIRFYKRHGGIGLSQVVFNSSGLAG